MTLQIGFIAGFLLNLAIVYNAASMLYRYYPEIPTKQFSISQFHLLTESRLIERTRPCVYFELAAAGFCGIYWLLKVIFELLMPKWKEEKQLKMKRVLLLLWKHGARPVTIILLLVSIYTTFLAFDDLGLIRSDISNFFSRIFYKLRDENREGNEELIRYMELVQRHYGCCGETSLLDWFGTLPGVDIYIPASCFDPRRSAVLTSQRVNDLAIQLKGVSVTDAPRYAPVFLRGCIKAVGDQLYDEFYSFLVCFNLIDLCLVSCLLIVSLYIHWNATRDLDPHPQQIKQKRYISNSKLLRAIQGTPLVAEQCELQDALVDKKAKWLNRETRTGWCLFSDGKQRAEYLRRVYARRTGYHGQVKTSAFRRALRSYLPLGEAILYTDGDMIYETEGNDFYGGFIATVVRVICCGLYGYLGAHIVIAAFLSRKRTDDTESDIAKTQEVKEEEENEAEILANLAFMAELLVRITFVVAAIISKRFRCFLTLLGPNLALNAGQSVIAAELTHVAVQGPVKGLATNLRAAGESLNCLMHIANNITKDANSILKPSGKSPSEEGEREDEEDDLIDDEDDDMFFPNGTMKNTTLDEERPRNKTVKYPKLKSLSEFNTFFVKIMKKASRGIRKGASKLNEMTQKLADEMLRDLDAGNPEVPKTGRITSAEKKRNREMQAANKDVSDSFQKHLAEMDTSESDRMREHKRSLEKKVAAATKSMQLMPNETKRLQEAVDLGHRIEANMRKRISKACMTMQQARTEQCNVAAITACYRLQTTAILSTGLPLYIGGWCASKVQEGTACPTLKALQQAKKECGNSAFDLGLKDGFGAQFAIASSGLGAFGDNFEFSVLFKKAKTAAEGIKSMGPGTGDVLAELTYLTMDATRAVYAIAMILSTLLKLLFVILLIKTQSYMTKYLIDMDFDNVYVEDVYEEIDQRRKNEGRMYMLPLKSHEKKAVFWHKKGYTKEEWKKAIKSVVKSTVLGGGLMLLFLADGYLHSIMLVLDTATRGDLQLSGSSSADDTAAMATMLGGEGFAAEIIKGVLDGFLSLMNVDLSYKLSNCAPKIIASSPNMKVRFGFLWTGLLLLGLFSGYLLRFRHVIMGFFYPNAHRRRQMHMYNTMLANRAKDLTTNRNLLIQRVRENLLQHEVQSRAKPTMLEGIAPKLVDKLKMRKGTCIVCGHKSKQGPDMYICRVDACAICRQCQKGISDDPEFCVACLDRNEETIDDTLRKLELMYYNRPAYRTD